ncbi:MAG: porin family protein [Candidatus Tectomicrobia bacterium]|nr:porin family protein [Candidatus Tectomicrobia bacterium]
MQRTWLVVYASMFISLSLVLIPHTADAEFFIDAYAGGAFTRESDVSFSILDTVANASIDTDDSLIVGGRLGYWFGFFPWIGLALDVSYFEMEGDPPSSFGDEQLPTIDNLGKANFEILPISALVMLRLPRLVSPLALLTRLNPYAAIGPAVFLTRVDFEGFEAAGTALGLDIRVGFRWEFLPVFGVFAEYRYTRVEDDFQDSLRDFPASLDVNFTTHHVLGGISLRF